MGLFASKYIIIGIIFMVVIGGGYTYFRVSKATIEELREQVASLSFQTQSLKAVNENIQQQVLSIQRAQQETNRRLDAIRSTSAQSTRALLNRKFDTSNIPLLQQRSNQETATAFRDLEQMSRAP